ncbi:hypothetical protein ACJMK2_032347 [Sinanodonta woodiana]|uniref:VWFD domain-containing protein n=1 Tax=Sinanodonta woodiana TaxID=1069815 RepID=A0ABD3X5I2_SINWO
MYILTYTYVMSVPTNETVLARIIRKTSLFIGNAILMGPLTNDGMTPPVFQETSKNRFVQNDTSIRFNDLSETNNYQTGKDNRSNLPTLDIIQTKNKSNKSNDFSIFFDFTPRSGISNQSTSVSTQSPSSSDSYTEGYNKAWSFVTTSSDKHSINSAEAREHNISSNSELNIGIENPEGITSSTDSAHNFLLKMSTFSFNSQQTMVVDLSTNTSPDTILIIDASAKVRIMHSCNENGRIYLQGDVVDAGQIGDCCYAWYCDSRSNVVYHEIPCLDHASHPAENLQMCVWKGLYYKPGEDIFIEHQNGLCHGIHCTCDSQVIELYGSPCNIIFPITDVKINASNTVHAIGTV